MERLGRDSNRKEEEEENRNDQIVYVIQAVNSSLSNYALRFNLMEYIGS